MAALSLDELLASQLPPGVVNIVRGRGDTVVAGALEVFRCVRHVMVQHRV